MSRPRGGLLWTTLHKINLASITIYPLCLFFFFLIPIIRCHRVYLFIGWLSTPPPARMWVSCPFSAVFIRARTVTGQHIVGAPKIGICQVIASLPPRTDGMRLLEPSSCESHWHPVGISLFQPCHEGRGETVTHKLLLVSDQPDPLKRLKNIWWEGSRLFGFMESFAVLTTVLKHRRTEV